MVFSLSKKGLLDRLLLFAQSIMVYNNSLPDNSTDDPNKGHYSLRGKK